MLKKLHVLAAAYRLRAFTIAELAKASGITEGTVHTVLKRVPEGWFTSAPTGAGTRGGQPHLYQLTEAGAAGIKGNIGKLPNAERLAPEQPATAVPMGLLSARESFQRLPTSNAVTADMLRKDALQSLDWAEAEIADGAFAESRAAIRAQIATLRQDLQGDTSGQTKSLGLDGSSSSIVRKIETLLSFFKKSPGQPRSSPSLPLHKIVISYFGVGAGARDMASFANGVISRELLVRGALDSLQDPLEVQELKAAISSLRQSKAAGRRARLVLCVADDNDTKEFRTVLEQASSLGSDEALVLDSGYNVRVAQITETLRLSYQPNASKPEGLHWVDAI